jgi:hypothetical protein
MEEVKQCVRQTEDERVPRRVVYCARKMAMIHVLHQDGTDVAAVIIQDEEDWMHSNQITPRRLVKYVLGYHVKSSWGHVLRENVPSLRKHILRQGLQTALKLDPTEAQKYCDSGESSIEVASGSKAENLLHVVKPDDVLSTRKNKFIAIIVPDVRREAAATAYYDQGDVRFSNSTSLRVLLDALSKALPRSCTYCHERDNIKRCVCMMCQYCAHKDCSARHWPHHKAGHVLLVADEVLSSRVVGDLPSEFVMELALPSADPAVVPYVARKDENKRKLLERINEWVCTYISFRQNFSPTVSLRAVQMAYSVGRRLRAERTSGARRERAPSPRTR